MRTLICSVACLVALLGCASPKPAATTAAATPAVGPAPLSDSQRAQQLIDKSIQTGEGVKTSDGKTLICKQESVTNTRLKNRKVCLTEEQWTARTDNAKDGFREAKSAGEYLPPKGN